MLYRIRDSSSALCKNESKIFLSIEPASCMISRIATHSKTDPREIIKKLRLSGFENLPEPSAMFKGILNEALDNWSFVVLSNWIDLISCFDSKWKVFAFLYTSRFWNSNIVVKCSCYLNIRILFQNYNSILILILFLVLKIKAETEWVWEREWRQKIKGQEENFSAFIFWYLGPESNRHTRKYRILNPARLPVPPPRHFIHCCPTDNNHLPLQAGAKIRNYFKSTSGY